MATRAEQAHADAQRTGQVARTKAAKTPKRRAAAKRGRTAAKATYAKETRSPEGRASRKSTRASANRAKTGSSLEIREERQKTSPESVARRARAKLSRVRGGGAKAR